jgi:hypothetical protein
VKPGVKVTCACGQAFMAPDAMRGKSARCPTCGGTISIPRADDLMGIDPLMMSDPLSMPAASPLADPLAARRPQQAAAPSPAQENQPPWLLIGLGGAAAAVVLVVATAAIVMSMGGRDVAQAPVNSSPLGAGGTPVVPGPPPGAAPSSAPPAAPSSNPSSPSATPSTPNPFAAGATAPSSSPTPGSATSSAAPGGATSPGTPASSASPSSASSGSAPSAFKETAPEGGMGISFLPAAAQSWHIDEKFRRRGVIRVGDAETQYGHYSWMTQLLPFLGHQKEYDKINFNQGLTDGDNLQVGATVIPAFLNPLDDRPKWKGYPLQGLALTHFVGMSGVEDARNVVAATLPRSDPRAGVFGYDEVASPAQITDGTSQTIMVIGSGTMANPWIMGGGGTVRGAREPYFDKVSGFGSRNLPQAGALTIMADGSVRFISANVDPAAFRSMCTIHGSDTVVLEKAAAPFLLDSITK